MITHKHHHVEINGHLVRYDFIGSVGPVCTSVKSNVCRDFSSSAIISYEHDGYVFMVSKKDGDKITVRHEDADRAEQDRSQLVYYIETMSSVTT